MHSDQQDVMERFRAGDETAVRELYCRHAGAIHTVARSMVRDPELVAEVVQQTFVKAWRGAAGFDDARPLAPWLYAIARRTAVDVLRREGRHQDVVSLDDGPQERPEASVEPVTFETSRR
jgi:RNA polymerase sigma-70 factor (ECF subfamily)